MSYYANEKFLFADSKTKRNKILKIYHEYTYVMATTLDDQLQLNIPIEGGIQIAWDLDAIHYKFSDNPFAKSQIENIYGQFLTIDSITYDSNFADAVDNYTYRKRALKYIEDYQKLSIQEKNDINNFTELFKFMILFYNSVLAKK